MKLKGKVAIITGGSKGIGLGCVRAFVRHGCTVVIAARGREAGAAAAQELCDAGHAAIFQHTDVARHEDLRAVIDDTVERFGRLDCLLNNAGWHPPEMTIEQTSLKDFEELMRLNLTSTFMGCKYALPHLRKTCGTIVNMSSAVAFCGQSDAASYVTTKAGQIGLTRALAIDLGEYGIRVNAVCPSLVATPLVEEVLAGYNDPELLIEIATQETLLKRLSTSEEIGELCAFLASDEASCITGQSIRPEAGLMPKKPISKPQGD